VKTLLGIAVGLALLVPGAGAAGRPELVLASTRDGDSELFLARADGQVVKRLTANRVADFAPRWSPDGTRIAFVSNRDGDDEIFVMHADGSGVRQLTRNRVRDETPAWSPDGTTIAFVHERPADLVELWTMRADGRDARRLVRASRGVNEQAYSPDWAPDGRTLVFSSNRPGDGNPELYRVRADGTGLTRLTRTAGDPDTLGDDGFPAFAPDGSSVVFTSNRAARNVELWTMRANGAGQRRLLVRPATDDLGPRWSPDGSRLAFVARSATDPEAAPRILVVRADGTGVNAIQAGAEVDWR
jgi:Tol biopolymer transport system component